MAPVSRSTSTRRSRSDLGWLKLSKIFVDEAVVELDVIPSAAEESLSKGVRLLVA